MDDNRAPPDGQPDEHAAERHKHRNGQPGVVDEQGRRRAPRHAKQVDTPQPRVRRLVLRGERTDYHRGNPRQEDDVVKHHVRIPEPADAAVLVVGVGIVRRVQRRGAVVGRVVDGARRPCSYQGLERGHCSRRSVGCCCVPYG